MSFLSGAAMDRRTKSHLRLALAATAGLVLLVAMALSTRIVKIGSASDVQPGTFSAAEFGKAEFPKVRAAIEGRAVSAATFLSALTKDRAAAVKDYGVAVGSSAEIAIAFTGVAGKEESGVYTVDVEGMPSSLTIRVQTGPAINGTDLRDATGTISFGQFVNQIDYQNAGSALNKEMKKQALAGIDPHKLGGKTLAVVGAFKLTDPNIWLVTPVKLDVR